MSYNNCVSCAAFKLVKDGLGPCLASGVQFHNEDDRGRYTMVAWCDGCSCYSKNLDECIEKKKMWEGDNV